MLLFARVRFNTKKVGKVTKSARNLLKKTCVEVGFPAVFISDYLEKRVTIFGFKLPIYKYDWDGVVKAALEYNTDLANNALFLLASKPDENVRAIVAVRISTPDNVVQKLSQDNSRLIRCIVASRVNIPLAVLNDLTSDSDSLIRERVANNPSISNAIIFTKDGRLVSNPVTVPLDTLGIISKLSRDKDWHVRYAVAKNRFLSTDFIGSLSVEEFQLKEALLSIRLDLAEDNNGLIKSVARMA